MYEYPAPSPATRGALDHGEQRWRRSLSFLQLLELCEFNSDRDTVADISET